jgi:muconolactone delta-isomerase
MGNEALVEQRGRLEQEQAERLEALDRIEARLVQAAGVTQLWRELGERRETVTEVACDNAAMHARGMARHQGKQEARVRELTRLAQAKAEKKVEAGSKHQGL